MTTKIEARGLARGRVESLDEELIVLSLPGTDYHVHLVPTVPAASIRTPVGKRITGRIEARALRIHPAQGGGQFIEPVWGMPRIVAGRVLAIEKPTGRVLIDVAIPMWVTPPAGQDPDVIHEGALVNFYVESGATFTPVEDGSGSA